MFKRLRERIAEEATKFPVGQLSNNSGKLLSEPENKPSENNPSEDLITLSDSSSVVVPHTSPQQFSIGEDEDGSLSEQSTPQKRHNASGDTYAHSVKEHSHSSVFSDFSFGPEYRPSKKLSYVPQSDIESEREEPPTLNLDEISKDQLLSAIQSLKARCYKYKNKYTEVVKNYKELREEKTKIENALIENQDKGLRRIGELREQCQLEQKAKAHLEENLRLLLDEKDSRICVLETQINLLKEVGKSSSTKTLPEDCENDAFADSKSEDSTTSLSGDVSVLQEKVERLQHQHNQDKKTITAQRDQISILRKQSENLSQELEEKVKRLNGLEDEQLKLKSDHETVLKAMQDRLRELEQQQEESVMSMAETKKNIYDELELKDKRLLKAEEESKFYQVAAEKAKEQASILTKKHEERVNELLHQLAVTEKTLEEEKQSLLQELAQGKAAAINLMQQECSKKVLAIEEEWKSKYEAIQSACQKAGEAQVKGMLDSQGSLQDKLNKAEQHIQELDSLVATLEQENASLKNSVEKLEANNIEAHHEERLRCMKDKLQNAEKNHKTQMEQLKTKLSQLEKENGILLSEKENLLVVQNHFKELKSMENKLQTELKLKDEELKKFQEKLETSSKEEVEKICTLQESMKDKENMILKLKANVESLSKDHSTTVEELNKKIKRLEVEREQLMLQAQERVSATEAKCREDVKSLQEKCDRLVSENGEIEKLKKQVLTLNSQLDESLLMAESNQAVASQEISVLKEKLACAETKLTEIEKSKSLHETELSSKLEKLQQENKELLCNSDHVEKLKTEKEELNEKLKKAVQQVNKISVLENECGRLKTENEELSKEVKHIKIIENESIFIREKLRIFEENESAMKKSMQDLSVENEKLKAEIVELKASFEKEKESLLSVNGGLKKKIEQLENSDLPVKDYVESLKKEYDAAIKAKDDDMLSKLKQLVRDFSLQMDVKDKDSELMITELMEKNQYLEEKLQKDHALEITALRQDLFEKDCALEEMRDSYEETIQERDALIKKYELAIKSLSAKEDTISHELINNAAEPSDWDDTWVVPDEVVENSSPIHEQKACQEHVQQIESLQEELSKSNSEIKELKVLLRLSPPETMVENNNRRDSLQSIPEPTEFEYLKNIIYEYMMGKEPVTLVKVIAAVLRFNDTQTQQVIRREEARHSTK